MIVAVLAALLWAKELRFASCDGICQVRGDTAEAALWLGGSALLLEFWDSRDTFPLILQATTAASGSLQIGQGGLFARWCGIPVRELDLEVRVAGESPAGPGWDRAAVEAELERLLGPAGVVKIRIREGPPLRIPKSSWDRNGNGKLDLWRDESPDRASSEELLLRRILGDSAVRFPQVVLFQDSIRLGWPLADRAPAGDTLLRLASGVALPWRDPAGRVRRYLLEGPSGERSDSFTIGGYAEGRPRVSAGGSAGGWRWDHPPEDLVVRPRTDFPAFGATDRNDARSAPILFIEAGATADANRVARVLAREIGHVGRLADVASPGNLMSAVLRMDVETPVLTPTQAVRLRDRLDCLFTDPTWGPVGRDASVDW